MNRSFALGAAACAIAGALALWLFASMERVPERIWVGYRGEARDNPWLAAERLLGRMERRTQRARSVPQLKALPPDGVLVMPRRLSSLDRPAQLALVAWIEAGGHLVVEAEQPRQPDPLLDALGIGRRLVERDAHRADPEAHRPDQGARRGRPEGTVEARLPGAERPLVVHMPQWRALEAKDAQLVLDEGGAAWLVHLARGAGRVTALNELSFAGNGSIGSHDHAEFLWQLANLGPQRGAVSFFYSPQKLSLWGWLVEHAWQALAGGALLLVLWLWRIVPRFGPVAPDPEPARKRLLDHLRASGRFQWSAGGGAALAEAAREAALRRLQRAQPDFGSLGPAEREARLASAFGLAPEAARLVLAARAPATPEDLVAATSVYQSLHEQLSTMKEPR